MTRKVLKNFRLRPDLLQRAQAFSEKTGLTLTKIIEQGIELRLKGTKDDV